MQLIDADKAQPGMTIVTRLQTNGKGQRGKTWLDVPGQNVLMSVITVPARGLDAQFAFSAQVATAIANALQILDDNWQVSIKWPNDIIVNDKKAGGILIENVLRGSKWLFAVIGLGVNVQQTEFPAALPHATSLTLESGQSFDPGTLQLYLREAILQQLDLSLTAAEIMKQYNDLLYKRNDTQVLVKNDISFPVTINGVSEDGCLHVTTHQGLEEQYVHGAVIWQWP